MFVVRTVVSLIANDLIEDDLREMLGFDDEMVGRSATKRQDKRIRKLERQAGSWPLHRPLRSMSRQLSPMSKHSLSSGTQSSGMHTFLPWTNSTTEYSQ